MTPETLRHLGSVDETLGALILRIGACELAPERRRSPFESLVRAVAHQQLHGTAAARILERFVALFPGMKFPDAEHLLAVSDDQLRAVGFSRSKIAAIRDIAAKTAEGVVPASKVISRLDDEEIIERLTQCRGVGRWTVEMLLIFKLGRPDVLPVDDFGVRQGYQITYGKRQFPKPKDLLKYGERWRPYRTTAAWYMWRAADAAKLEKQTKKP
ncbi:MAG TPA: DNA-3-methyladenine glycosylase [Candidatus Limnocylindria bacterium]|jgi:DNA-3-methyladenine glycosylase II|nr:DNA-3-methyladenine glycosylase [Candidatus Limnocylindria bacterium]